MKRLITIIIVFFLLFSFLYAQNKKEDIETVRRDLDKVTEEIRDLEKKIGEEQKREKLTERSINNLSKEIYLRQTMINRFSKAEKQVEKSINYTKNEISERENEIEYLRDLLKKRVVHLYKYGRTNEVEAILLSDSFSKTLVRLKYIMFLANKDKENIQKIKENIQELNIKNDELLEDLSYQRELTNKKRIEYNQLARRQRDLKKKKEEIKNNREAYLAELKKKESSQRKLLESFAELGRGKREVPLVIPPKGISFSSLMGKMIWPVKGTILSHYGMNYNPELKTRKNNLGIDIKAPYGADVYCVGYGRIREPLWLPGYGTILIIEHDKGYITAYAHISEIIVELDEEVLIGQVIAKVGDVESFEGPKLNFQIWYGGKNLNPERWLSKRIVSAVVK